MRGDLDPNQRRSSGLVDVLDRVLDKGLVVAGDIKVSLAEVELLTIRIRLLVCSIDKAEQIGLDWWRYESHFSGGSRQIGEENKALKEQVLLLERKLALLSAGALQAPLVEGGTGARIVKSRASARAVKSGTSKTASPKKRQR